MTAPHARRNPIFASDIRELGGVVSVHVYRDLSGDGGERFRISHISRGGDVAFLSKPILIEDHAMAAARLLAEFVGGVAENVPRVALLFFLPPDTAATVARLAWGTAP
jgi:hypothetical protein